MTETRRVGIIMNGVTGRMGRNQHLARSIVAIRDDGGVRAGDVLLMPDPILVGRDLDRVRSLADAFGISRYSTNLEECLAEPEDTVYFDAQTTSRREEAVKAAIAAGKDIYCEKPTATSSARAFALADIAEAAGVRNGTVQDKLFLPGILKLAEVIESGILGRLHSVKIEFGYWVFPDATGATQRPSWNYRSEEGGGIVLDMFCHFHYLLDRLVGPVRSVSCRPATHMTRRVDENGETYTPTADDAAYAIFELDDDVVAQVNASWCVRPYRDDLFTIQVDGRDGTAAADLRRCRVQPGTNTPRFVWNPDVPQDGDPRDSWLEVPQRFPAVNGFRRQWELFLGHLVTGAEFPWSLRQAARGVALAEAALRSADERRWIDLP